MVQYLDVSQYTIMEIRFRLQEKTEQILKRMWKFQPPPLA